MNKQQIEEIIFRVLSQYGEEEMQELPLEFPVEVSARHVHLTEEAVEQLFGTGAKLTPKRPLSQPGQFLSEERVTLVTSKGRIENVAVLGPARSAIQTELSLTDCRALGLQAPLRMSGDLEGAADVYIFGPKGVVFAKESVIIAQAHIHITPADAEKIGIVNGQKVSVDLPGERSMVMDDVICRISEEAGLAMHIDFDEANGCMLKKNAKAKMRVSVKSKAVKEEIPAFTTQQIKLCDVNDKKIEKDDGGNVEKEFDGKLITEAIARQLVAEKVTKVTMKKGLIVTPAAKDVFRQAKVKLV